MTLTFGTLKISRLIMFMDSHVQHLTRYDQPIQTPLYQLLHGSTLVIFISATKIQFS